MDEVFARKLRHHEDILYSAGMKSKQKKKEANMIDGFVNAFRFFFVHFSSRRTISRFFFAPFNLCCDFFSVEEIPIVCNLSSMNSFGVLFVFLLVGTG